MRSSNNSTAKRIVMPYAGSQRDQELLNIAFRVAHETKAHLSLLHVLIVPMTLGLDAPDVPGEPQARLMLTIAERQAKQAGCQASSKLVRARDAGHAILEFAAEDGCDLIMMEARPKDTFEDKATSRTADYVLENAKCAVWVTKSTKHRAGDAI